MRHGSPSRPETGQTGESEPHEDRTPAFGSRSLQMSSLARTSRRLSAPEQIDRALSVTSARGWIALLAVLATATGVGFWSVFGEVATYVEADGILLNRGGKVVDASATGNGRVTAITVSVGDEIQKGDLVSTIVNSELAARHASALALVEEREQALDALKAAVAAESRVVLQNNAQRRNQLEELEAIARELLTVTRANFVNSKRLLEKGIVTRLRLERTQQEFNEARRVLLDLSRDRGALEASEIKYNNENLKRIRDMTHTVEAAKREVREIEALLTRNEVTAPVSGQVIEIKVTIGAAVNPGTAVASIRTGTSQLEVLLYVPPAEGKRVLAGMQAFVSPATVRREEFGAIRGTVTSVSPFPVSFKGMVAVLQNPSLARSFSKEGPPYAGGVTLASDPSTASGFAWTSPKAANQRPTAGTLASVEIKTRSQPPITLAVPLLKELLGIR